MFLDAIKYISIINIIDILVVSYIFYKFFNLIKETRAEQLLKGILLILVLMPISDIFNLKVLKWILDKTITIGLFTFVVIFQPEIRKALEKLGTTSIIDKHSNMDNEQVVIVVEEIVNAVEALAATKTGALIVLEQKTGLGDIMNTGTKIDAMVSSALLENIFVVNTPLHDGACIIRDNRIAAAGCFLPLSTNEKISKKLGTRHRAGLGVSENSDGLVIIVSEETGVISIALNGKLIRHYNRDSLKRVLLNVMKKEDVSNNGLREKVKSWIKKRKSN